MLNVFKNFINSEKAVASFLVLIIAAVFAGMDKISVQEWIDLAKYVLTVYVAGKTVQGAAAVLSKNGEDKQALAKLKEAVASNDAAADAAADAKE